MINSACVANYPIVSIIKNVCPFLVRTLLLREVLHPVLQEVDALPRVWGADGGAGGARPRNNSPSFGDGSGR